ncbi:hypothetical protein EVA_21209, partial [gut metagenome]
SVDRFFLCVGVKNESCWKKYDFVVFVAV